MPCAASFAQPASLPGVFSPDRETMFEIGLNSAEELQYRVTYLGREVISWSPMGLLVNHLKSAGKVTITSSSRRSFSENIPWRLGENSSIQNNYNELTVSCRSAAIEMTVEVRVFDGSIAFRYVLPKQAQLPSGSLVINREQTQFNFTSPYHIYQYHHESVFTPVRIDSLSGASDLPSTLRDGKVYLTIGEAANDQYTKAELTKGTAANSLAVAFLQDTALTAILPFQTPWRTVGFSQTAIGLHAHSELPLKLNPQPYQAVPDWIKPGKVMRSELNTQSAFDCINLVKKLGFQYVMFDAGWYGPERSPASNPALPIPAIDMPKVISYARENGVGIILYVNYIGLQHHLDTILPLYKKWGISGLKFGFIDGFTQKGITWLSDAIKKVNDAGLFINIHDNYKPTGLNRTYPALLTQEGIRGDENSPDAFHTTVLPYTRFLAGAADFTFCFPNPKNDFSRNLKVSKAQQLALTVVYFSPLQHLFWYGRPLDYTNLEELEFFTHVPTVWDETRYLKGEIGENISVSRRKGNTWYVGNAAGFSDWKGSLLFDFLDAGKKYEATVYEDAGGSIVKRVLDLKKRDDFPFEIKAKGGMAMIIRPLENQVSKKKRVFVHPGILHNKASLRHFYAVNKKKYDPEYGSFEILSKHPLAQADYQLQGPFKTISRDGEFAFTKNKMEADFSAAYLNAVMWSATKNPAYAKKSISILEAYADTLSVIPPTNDAPLLVGLEGIKIINAIEILRFSYKPLSKAQLSKVTKMITTVFLPVAEKFYRVKAYTNGNWGAAVTKMYISAAIFLDNEDMYNKALDFYLNGNDNGTIKNYISGTTGQIQESGRDQGHTQLGIGCMATVCEIAYNQGDDLYGLLENRLLKGFEYAARYNLGNDDLPFETWKDVTGKYSSWTKISPLGRGKFIPIYEMVYNHYVKRKGLKMPYTEEVLKRIRPEGYDRDQPAFGTLFYYGAE
ncbi:glycoside hydrolase family 97 catalytic domain-containing protein [Pedobacter sp. AW31-3R]|uniref:glycoside hydrolase family 97 catalytic domain-containing protein n=1 Tax=Pedobacter sp. AW31-3R TaxID=3445781 RepID=UPI003FA0CDF0